jgi:hypothetical protein
MEKKVNGCFLVKYDDCLISGVMSTLGVGKLADEFHISIPSNARQ